MGSEGNVSVHNGRLGCQDTHFSELTPRHRRGLKSTAQAYREPRGGDAADAGIHFNIRPEQRMPKVGFCEERETAAEVFGEVDSKIAARPNIKSIPKLPR